MAQRLNILKTLKTLFLIVIMALFLCACASGNKAINATSPDGEDGNASEQEELYEQQRSCWQAQLLSMFYDTMSKSSVKAYPEVTKSAMPFIMVAFAVWMSIRLLKHVSSVAEESPAQVWNEIARMAFVCVCCGLLASSTGALLFVLNKIIFPIYYAFLEYGSLVLNALTTDGDVSSPGIYLGPPGSDKSGALKGVCVIYTNSLVCKMPDVEEVSIVAGTVRHFPTGPSDMMQCLTCAVSDRMQLGFGIANNLMSMKNFSSVICGLIIYSIFIIVKIAFVFYIVDSIFRMNIMVILLPCFILAYPFKFSRKWTKTGFLMIINSAAVLAFMAIIAAMAMLAMQIVLTDNAELIGNRDLYVEFGIMPLMLVLIAFLVQKSIAMAVTLANSLVGGGGSTDFQKKVGKLAAQVAKKVFVAITGKIGKIIANNPKAEKLRQRLEEAKRKLNEMAGRNE